MRHVVVGGKSVLLGDAVTSLLVRYAALVARRHSADAVDLQAWDAAGARTTLTVLLDEGLTLSAEDVGSDLEEPDNREAEAMLRTRIEAVAREEAPDAAEIAGVAVFDTEQPE